MAGGNGLLKRFYEEVLTGGNLAIIAVVVVRLSGASSGTRRGVPGCHPEALYHPLRGR